MHAEPAVDRRRIDQPRKDRPAGKAEIIALGEHERRHLSRPDSPRCGAPAPARRGPRHSPRRRSPACRRRGRRIAPASAAPDSDRRSTGVSKAIMPPRSSSSPHSASMKPWLSMMPDSGDNNAPMQTSSALERARGVAADHLQPFDAVLQSLRQQRLDLGELRRIGRDDELAAFVDGRRRARRRIRTACAGRARNGGRAASRSDSRCRHGSPRCCARIRRCRCRRSPRRR